MITDLSCHVNIILFKVKISIYSQQVYSYFSILFNGVTGPPNIAQIVKPIPVKLTPHLCFHSAQIVKPILVKLTPYRWPKIT